MIYVAGILNVVLCICLCGIPFGYIVSMKGYNTDIRTVGSKNVGSTNVFRMVGKVPGLITFILDGLKGYVSMALSLYFLNVIAGIPTEQLTCSGEYAWFLGLLFFLCVASHIWSLWLHFKGGKGIACGFGVALCVIPYAAFAAFIAWFTLCISTKRVSIGSIGAAVALPIFTLICYMPTITFELYIIAVSALVIWAHRSNIKCLMAGTELTYLSGQTHTSKGE